MVQTGDKYGETAVSTTRTTTKIKVWFDFFCQINILNTNLKMLKKHFSGLSNHLMENRFQNRFFFWFFQQIIKWCLNGGTEINLPIKKHFRKPIDRNLTLALGSVGYPKWLIGASICNAFERNQTNLLLKLYFFFPIWDIYRKKILFLLNFLFKNCLTDKYW